jgi:hypothetical protein
LSEPIMSLVYLAAGRKILARGLFAAGLVAAGLGLKPGAGLAGGAFPFDQDLILDTAPMSSAKRVPMLNVAPDGAATIDLWCQSVRGFVQLADTAIRIEPGPLPETLPPYVSPGQCTPERMQADHDVLVRLSQATGWQRRGNSVILEGPAPLRFRLSDH